MTTKEILDIIDFVTEEGVREIDLAKSQKDKAKVGLYKLYELQRLIDEIRQEI